MLCACVCVVCSELHSLVINVEHESRKRVGIDCHLVLRCYVEDGWEIRTCDARDGKIVAAHTKRSHTI